jgi:predicted NBD/HSP70 family sugar kinase
MTIVTTRSTELLRIVHRHPGVTRADAARMLGIGTGAATELVTKLSRATLLTQAPAAPSGTRGRPTTVLLPHPDGPLVLALAVTHEAWRLDVVELGGATAASVAERHGDGRWSEVRAAVAAAIKDLTTRYGRRLRAIGISVPGPVSRTLRLAATAEHRRGAATGAAVALHLRIEAGLGGAVIEDGRPVIGAHGAAGEFGHMPFGDPAVRCGCGANGCWGTAVDGTALARLLGTPRPRDPVTYARRVIATAARAHSTQRARQDLAGLPPPASAPPSTTSPPASTASLMASAVAAVAPAAAAESLAANPYSSGEAGPDTDPIAAAEAVRSVGIALGRGIAGLVNALDPDLVTLGGLGVDLLATVPEAIESAYRDGLMLIHRESPPPVLPAALPDDEGPIAGAAEEAWSALLPHLT